MIPKLFIPDDDGCGGCPKSKHTPFIVEEKAYERMMMIAKDVADDCSCECIFFLVADK